MYNLFVFKNYNILCGFLGRVYSLCLMDDGKVEWIRWVGLYRVNYIFVFDY